MDTVPRKGCASKTRWKRIDGSWRNPDNFRLMNRKNLIVISVTVLLLLLSWSSWLYLLPIFLKELGADDRMVGLSYTLFTLGGTGFQIFGGFFADRWGRKPTVVFPTYFNALLVFMLAFSKIWWVVTIIYTLTAIFSSIQWPAFLAIIGESCYEREKAFSIFELSVAGGFAIGPLVGFFLLKYLNVRQLMIISAFVYLGSAFLRHIALSETLKERKIVSFSLKGIFTRSVLAFLAGSVFLYLLFSITINGPFITLHMKSLGLTERRINLLISFSTLFSLLVSVLSAKILNSKNLLKFYITAIMVHSITIFIWAHFMPGVINTLLLMISFGAVQLVFIGYNTIVTSLSPESKRARTIGTIGTVNGLVSSGGPYIGMMVKVSYGIFSTFILGIIFGWISSFIFSRLSYPNTTSR